MLKLANVLTTAVIAHILDPRDFGVYAVALTAYGIVNAVGEFGLGLCLIRADLDIDSLAPTMSTVAVTTNAIQAGVMFVFARPIAGALGSVAAAGPIRVLALAMLVTGVFAVPGAQLIRDFKQDKIFLATLIGFVPSTAVLVLLAMSGSGAMAFAWSMVVGNIVSGCVVFASVPRHYRLGFSRSALNVLVKFGFPLAGANIVNYVLLNGDYAVVGHLAGAVALGAYVLAFNVASWPYSLLGFMVNNVSIPAISRVKDDPVRLKNAIARALRAVSLVVMPISALTIALARPLVLTLYGPKWMASVQPLSILASYGAISVICVLFANVLAGLGRAKFILMVQLVWLLALVPGMVLGVRHAGIVGAAIAHVIVIVPIVLPIYLFGLRKVTDLAMLARACMPALLAASAAALAAAAVASQFTYPLVQLIAGLAAGGLTYAVIAIPSAMPLLSQEQITKLRMRRILRLYNIAAWQAGLRSDSQLKHAGKTDGGRAQQIPAYASRDYPSGLAAGLADAYDEYAAPLYSYCHWMLHEPTDAAAAVEQTFVTAVTEFGDLSDRGELRLWLYGVARDECYRRMYADSHFWSLDVVSQPADFGGDIVHAEVRRLIWATLAGLKPRQREVVELSLRHDLNDADLAAVLGTSWSRAHALSSRARSELENGLRVLLVARTGREDCPALDQLLTGWDGQLTTQKRHLVGQHIEQCQACASHMPGALRPEALFDLLPSAAPPVALREQVLRRCAEVTRDAATSRSELLQHKRFPRVAGPGRRDRGGRNHRATTVAVAAVLSVTAAVSGALIVFGAFRPAPTLADQANGRTSTAASPPATVRRPTRTRAGSSPSPKHKHSSKPTVVPIVAPLVSPTVQATPSPTEQATPSPSSSPKPSPSKSASPSKSPSKSPSPSRSPTPSPSVSSTSSPSPSA